MSLVSSSVSLLAPLATYTNEAAFKKNATEDDAVAIGNLDSQASVITISEAGENAATSVTATFKVTTGGITSLSSTIRNVVTAACATFQLMDSDGNV
ncbi:MAG: hypothetical protein PHW76_02385, partial [Alphaproteobacteria bacterium]|nr:hypothetical protein [Alphaproteobacteria bacterium]